MIYNTVLFLWYLENTDVDDLMEAASENAVIDADVLAGLISPKGSTPQKATTKRKLVTQRESFRLPADRDRVKKLVCGEEEFTIVKEGSSKCKDKLYDSHGFSYLQKCKRGDHFYRPVLWRVVLWHGLCSLLTVTLWTR